MTPWESHFEPAPEPEWLVAFDASAAKAVDELLWKRSYFGSLNAEEPEELLIDWSVLLAGDDGFVARLDAALSLWVGRMWGDYPSGSTARLADAWSRLFHVVANVEGLDATVEALRERFSERDEYLGPISVSPSRDPLGSYLAAVASHQKDRSLAPIWWQLCDLPAGVPFYHGIYAISGLLGIPAVDESEAGAFREEVAHGLVKLSRALCRLIAGGVVAEGRAREEWLALGRLAMARLPFPTRWREVLERSASLLPTKARPWVETLWPGFRANRPPPAYDDEPRRESSPAPNWRERAMQAAEALRRRKAGALEQAEALLSEQELYAQRSGDASHLAKSLTTLSKAIGNSDPDRALGWCRKAQLWTPQDPFSWSSLTQALWRARGAAAAEPVARESVERFPEDPVAATTLAEVLLAQGRLEEAEEVYQETKERFPGNAFARTQVRPVEVREETVRYSPSLRLTRQDRALWTSEARFLRRWARRGGDASRGRLPQELRLRAEILLNRVLAAWPFDARALSEKSLLLIDQGRPEEARRSVQDALQRQPHHPALVAALARAERELATRQGWSLSDDSEEKVFAAPGALWGIDRTFEPVARLQRGRAILALSDGHVRLEKASRELEALHVWIRPRLELDPKSFETWWSRRVNEEIFAPVNLESKVLPEHVPAISDLLRGSADRVDALEEDYWLRWTASSFLPDA